MKKPNHEPWGAPLGKTVAGKGGGGAKLARQQYATWGIVALSRFVEFCPGLFDGVPR
jgi:hypothetical protein